jgi:hypothetical protein
MADCPLTSKHGHGGLVVESKREITPAQAFGIIAQRIETRIETLNRVSETGYAAVTHELGTVLKQVRKAQQYFMS